MRTTTCRSCKHFDDDPASIEAQLPGITILGSAYGSVRGDAGICRVLQRFMEPIEAADCERFEPRSGYSARRVMRSGPPAPRE
jgi:hypothetical protein